MAAGSRCDNSVQKKLRKTPYLSNLPFAADLGERRPDAGRHVRRGDLELQTPHPRTDIDERQAGSRGVDVGRKGLFHADRRTAPADVARHGQQLLHRDQVGLLVARYACGGLEVDLVVGGHHAYEMPRAVAPQHEGLEYASDIFSQLFGHVCRRKVFFVDPGIIW